MDVLERFSERLGVPSQEASRITELLLNAWKNDAHPEDMIIEVLRALEIDTISNRRAALVGYIASSVFNEFAKKP